MSKTMNKIGTIFAAVTLVGATMVGAMAADLSQLPAPFVQNGVADVAIVVGANAATADVLGSIDIASMLQANAVTTTAVETSGNSKATVEGGASIDQSGNPLLLGGSLQTAKPRMTSSDLPDLLADGDITLEANSKDYKYSQYLTFGSGATVNFDKNPSGLDTPTLYLNTRQPLWTYNMSVRGTPLDLTNATNSETITMLGKTFTFDPTTTATGDIVLYGSDNTQYLTLNQPETVQYEGKSYTVEITGGNSNSNSGTSGSGTVVVSVNGVSKTVKQDDSVTINGLPIFAKDVFVTDIPTLSAAATLFVGSQKITFSGGASPSPAFSTLQVNGDSINGLQAEVWGTNNAAVSSIVIEFTPGDLNSDVSGFDRTDYLAAGSKISDPLFGTFNLDFVGPTSALDDTTGKVPVTIDASGREVQLTFTNDDGNVVKFSPFYAVGQNNVSTYFVGANPSGSGRGYNGIVTAGQPILDRQQFIVQEGSASSTQQTKVYEVSGWKLDSSVDYVQLRELGSDTTAYYKVGDQVGSSSAFVASVNQSARNFTLTTDTDNKVYLQGGRNYLTLDNDALAGVANINLTEASSAALYTTPSSVNVSVTSGGSSYNEAQFNVVYPTALNDADNKVAYALDSYGTYVKADVDTDRTYVDLFVPRDRDFETTYQAFIEPIGATVSTGSSTAGQVTTQVINPIAVGSAVLDSSVNLATESKNLIVVGGPCANSVAAALLNASATNCAAGFTPGKAIIQLFDTPMGKTAMLVAGYEATETQAASRAVALLDKRLNGTSVTLTVTNTNDFSIASSQ